MKYSYLIFFSIIVCALIIRSNAFPQAAMPLYGMNANYGLKKEMQNTHINIQNLYGECKYTICHQSVGCIRKNCFLFWCWWNRI